MSRLWIELLESELTSGDEKRMYSAIRKIAEDDTGDVTFIERHLAEMLLSNLPRWISVKDRLPKQDERVLVWLWEKGKIDIDVIRREGKSDGGGLQFIKNYLHNITFWIPLPAPPNTGKENKLNTFCPNCGCGVAVDEDGCCRHCGATSVGEAVDQLFNDLADQLPPELPPPGKEE